MDKKLEKWIKNNTREIVTIVVEGSVITTAAVLSGKRKAICLLWVGAAELVRLIVDKYFWEVNDERR